MKTRTLFMGAITVALLTGAASAQPYDRNGPDRNSQPNGAYDRNGPPDQGRNDRRDDNRDYNDRDNRGNNGNYYRQGAYEQNCHSGNQAAGTIFGALAGGLIGSAASHGNGGAVVGGAVLGGLLGNTISKDISCDSQPYAFRTYSDGLNGRVGQRYNWNHGSERGYFTPTREYRRSGTVCRDFSETTYSNGRSFTRSGTSCRAQDGNWRFD